MSSRTSGGAGWRQRPDHAVLVILGEAALAVRATTDAAHERLPCDDAWRTRAGPDRSRRADDRVPDRVERPSAAVSFMVTADEIAGITIFAGLGAAERERLARAAADISPLPGEYRAAYHVRGRIESSRGAMRRMYTTAFGRPREERRDPRWRAASPLTHADPSDPPELVVTQRNADRRAEATRFAARLGQRAGDVLALDYSHAAMSRRLGSANDPKGLTTAVLAVLARELR
jgi:hypothetical protein